MKNPYTIPGLALVANLVMGIISYKAESYGLMALNMFAAGATFQLFFSIANDQRWIKMVDQCIKDIEALAKKGIQPEKPE